MKKLIFAITLAIAFLLCSCNPEPSPRPTKCVTIQNNTDAALYYRLENHNSHYKLEPTESHTAGPLFSIDWVDFYRYLRTEYSIENNTIKPTVIVSPAVRQIMPDGDDVTVTVTNSGDTLIFNFT